MDHADRLTRATVRLRAAGLLSALLLAGCGGGGGDTTATPAADATGAATAASPQTGTPAASDWQWNLPAHFPVPKVPADNPMSSAKVALGRFLFYERRLSGFGNQSCGSCHQPQLGFTDGRARAIGSTGDATPRGTQGLANVAYNASYTWANPRQTSLEVQLLVPLFGTSPVEMGVNDGNKAQVLRRIQDDPDYPARFAAAFPGQADAIQWDNIGKAIAAFERTMISAGSRYDQQLSGQDVLTAQETRGRQLFFSDRAACSQCHGGFNFTDQAVDATTPSGPMPFHNTGLFNIGGTGAYPVPNRGVFELTGVATDMGRFRAPSLRNVALTAPYMHDGSLTTLDQVLAFYAAGGRNIVTGPYAGDGRLNPFKSALINTISLTAADQADLIAFLNTLTDNTFVNAPALANPFSTP